MGRVDPVVGDFLDLEPGEERFVKYTVTYKRRKMGPELNTVKKKEPI